MKLIHQEQKYLLRLLKMEQMTAPSGNLRLTVEDSDANTTNALAQVENAVSAEAVNLTLDQIVSKGKWN